MRPAAVLGLALLAALAGCSTEPILQIEVKTDLVPGVEFSRVEVRLADEVVDETEVRLADVDYREGRRVAELGPLEPDPMRLVEVRLLDDASRVAAERRVLVDHQGPLSIRLLITRSCRDVSCATDGGETCFGGRCVEVSCLDGEQDACGEPDCSADTDCAAGSACVEAACVEGACVLEQREGTCGSGEFCDPSGGCTSVPPLCETGCDDGEPCTDDTCVEGFGCRHAYNGTCPSGCESQTEIPVTECAALEAFWNATGGPSWNQTRDWLLTSTPCSWHGVSCEGGNVTGLELRNNNLRGPVITQLTDLTRLAVLDLRTNALNGPVPPELSQLTELRVLHFYQNELTGPIPVELSQLTNLEVLWLRANQLTGNIPPELGLLVNLTELQISSNQLDGPIPPELGSLVELRSLHLHTNQLTGPIPRELTALTQMRDVYFDRNMLSGEIPAGFELWQNVTTFELVPNGCFTAETPALAAWLDANAGDWTSGCN